MKAIARSYMWWPRLNDDIEAQAQRCQICQTVQTSSYGLPEEGVSDNGPQFVSHDFTNFMKMNGIKHTLTPPYHPASNRAAERSVQMLKQALRKQVASHHEGQPKLTIEHRLANFLFRREIHHTL